MSVVCNCCWFRQRSHSQVRLPRDSWPQFTVSNSRLPQPGGPGPRIYIPQEQGGPIIPQALGSLFVASYDSQGYGGVIRRRQSLRWSRNPRLCHVYNSPPYSTCGTWVHKHNTKTLSCWKPSTGLTLQKIKCGAIPCGYNRGTPVSSGN
jgi:hypothetical protein